MEITDDRYPGIGQKRKKKRHEIYLQEIELKRQRLGRGPACLPLSLMRVSMDHKSQGCWDKAAGGQVAPAVGGGKAQKLGCQSIWWLFILTSKNTDQGPEPKCVVVSEPRECILFIFPSSSPIASFSSSCLHIMFPSYVLLINYFLIWFLVSLLHF